MRAPGQAVVRRGAPGRWQGDTGNKADEGWDSPLTTAPLAYTSAPSNPVPRWRNW